MNYPEYVMRVKLPSSAAYHSSPSGDTEFEIAYDTAIKSSLPPGFEICRQKPNEKWAKDSEGRSLVLIQPTDRTETLTFVMEENKRLTEKLAKIRAIVGR